MADGSDIPPPDPSRQRPSIHVVEYRRPENELPVLGPSRELDDLVSNESSGLTRLFRLLVVTILIALVLMLTLIFIGVAPR